MRVSIDSFDPAEVADGGRGRRRAGPERERHQPRAGRRLGRGGRGDPRPARDRSRASTQTIEFLDRAGRAVPHRPDPRADRLRLRGLARPLSRGPPPLSRGGDDDGRRQPDRADRRRLGRRQHDPGRVLPGAGDPERPDDGRDQLGAVVGARARPGPPAGPSRRVATHTCPSTSSPVWSRCATRKVAEFGADNLAELQRRIRDPNWRIFAEGGMIYALNNQQSAARPRSVRALRADGRHRRRRTRSTSATS